jgi:hypothetical protein
VQIGITEFRYNTGQTANCDKLVENTVINTSNKSSDYDDTRNIYIFIRVYNDNVKSKLWLCTIIDPLSLDQVMALVFYGLIM